MATFKWRVYLYGLGKSGQPASWKVSPTHASSANRRLYSCNLQPSPRHRALGNLDEVSRSQPLREGEPDIVGIEFQIPAGCEDRLIPGLLITRAGESDIGDEPHRRFGQLN